MNVGATIRECVGHRLVERSWLSERGWNRSSWCDRCGDIRYWTVITEQHQQQALDNYGVVVAERPAL